MPKRIELPVHGRGASGNLPNRFEQIAYERDDAEPEEDMPGPRTSFYKDTTRSFIAFNDSPDIAFDASINPYRGCEHGCIYCFARPTHEYLGFSAGLDFETRIMVKEDAPELLREELLAKKWTPQTIGISGVTDPYQPVERKLEITRRCLGVLAEFRNPVAIITKNQLVARDVDHLAALAQFGAASVFVSITTLDPKLARIMEPRTSTPENRLKAIETLSKAGVPCGVMVAPVVPAITDHEMPHILAAAAAAGAREAGYVVLRLPWAVSPLFQQWLEEHYPDRKEKVLNRIKDLRDGKMYDSRWGKRQSGEGIFAEQIRSLFDVSCRKAKLNEKSFNLSAEHFRRPTAQGSLF
jgi:DNA repair photolyase